MEPDTMRRIEAAVEELAARDYPEVWIGEQGVTPEQYLWAERFNEGLPEEMQVRPGEFVPIGDEGAGIQIPKVGYEYLDGLWVLENMRGDLDETTEVELHREVLYINAAKRGEVPVITDSQERYEAGIGPEIRRVPLADLSPEEAASALEELEFYASEPSAPMMGGGGYVIEDTPKAWAALEKRLEA